MNVYKSGKDIGAADIGIRSSAIGDNCVLNSWIRLPDKRRSPLMTDPVKPENHFELMRLSPALSHDLINYPRIATGSRPNQSTLDEYPGQNKPTASSRYLDQKWVQRLALNHPGTSSRIISMPRLPAATGWSLYRSALDRCCIREKNGAIRSGSSGSVNKANNNQGYKSKGHCPWKGSGCHL